jgi:hypothetical protein
MGLNARLAQLATVLGNVTFAETDGFAQKIHQIRAAL